mmetsp:Transcript_9238/g.19855  ORF Transcript_9238/g.19855 Transcript_9238/m.19855 type:complete len:80 (+) Transcript_9238:157-396(+)
MHGLLVAECRGFNFTDSIRYFGLYGNQVDRSGSLADMQGPDMISCLHVFFYNVPTAGDAYHSSTELFSFENGVLSTATS